MISFSIVINTLERADLLQETLESLERLRYAGQFEVIVVDGPSSDHTGQIIEAWTPRIRAATCPVANLSVSRNIGISMARGDVVAFIDDDAIPEPEWLSHLAAAYADPQVGGAGGKVCDQSGYTFQYEYATATRLADTDWAAPRASGQLCFPGSFRFPYLQGTNASFRRTALLEVDGFDEEFEYFLDETDLCCRLIDAGYLLKQLPNAYVHHKSAPNRVRNEQRLTVAHYAILKNTLYFSLKHGLDFVSLQRIWEVNAERTATHRANVIYLVEDGRIAPDAIPRFEDAQVRALETGMRRGLEGRRGGLTQYARTPCTDPFLPFQARAGADARTIVLVSRDYPPGHSGGIATYSRDLAEGLAAAGHQVHVIAASDSHDQVELRNGVWVHRMTVKQMARTPAAAALAIPQPIWDWCAAALEEARRIASLRPVDVVEAPVWDAEGAAFMLDGTWPLVTSLHTTLHFWLQEHPELHNDPAWMRDFGTPMLALEVQMMQRPDAVRSNSQAIRREIERAYGFQFDPARLLVTPLGMPDVQPPPQPQAAPRAGDRITVLFVGRLEARKGIDVLLDAVPRIMAANPAITLRIVGDHTIAQPGKSVTYRDAWCALEDHQQWRDRVVFEGRIDDAALRDAYRDCDLFVAPSRFESFGLVYLEAMREAKPVIGCRAGGIPEVVDDGVNGLLVPPGDSTALADAIVRLAASAALRADMGAAGRARFLQQFTAARMAAASLPVYDLAAAQFAPSAP